MCLSFSTRSTGAEIFSSDPNNWLGLCYIYTYMYYMQVSLLDLSVPYVVAFAVVTRQKSIIHRAVFRRKNVIEIKVTEAFFLCQLKRILYFKPIKLD